MLRWFGRIPPPTPSSLPVPRASFLAAAALAALSLNGPSSVSYSAGNIDQFNNVLAFSNEPPGYLS